MQSCSAGIQPTTNYFVALTVQSLSHANDIRRAASWLLLGVSGGLVLDLCAKEFLRSYALQEFIFLRCMITVSFFLILAPRCLGGFRVMRTQRWKWHALRALLSVGTMFGFFYGVSHMPLVNALTLVFTEPLMVTALAVPFLGEHVGWRRWVAVFVGFAGVLIMLQPGSTDFSLASAAVLFAAFCYAMQAITARHLGASESTLSLAVYAVFGPLLVSTGALISVDWIAPDNTAWLLLVGAGIGSVIAWVGIINGYKSASPALLAPLEYTALVGGAFAGYVLWGEVPGQSVLVGGAVIIGSGSFVFYRELDNVPRDSAS
jgi:drug/metabolite transporter (DMT)-like permease